MVVVFIFHHLVTYDFLPELRGLKLRSLRVGVLQTLEESQAQCTLFEELNHPEIGFL